MLFARLLIIFVQQGFALPGNVQSLIVAVMALIVGFLVMIFGLLADRIGDSRRLMEEVLYRLRREEVARLAQEQVDHPPPEEPDRPQSGPARRQARPRWRRSVHGKPGRRSKGNMR